MSAPEPSVADRGGEPDSVTARQAMVVVAVLTVVTAVILLNLAFGTSNTPSSVGGRTATSSQHVD